MQKQEGDARPRRIGPVHALLAAAALGLVVMPIAFAGAQGPKGSASAKRQLRALTQRVALLEAKQGPRSLPPTGPAGGDLTGNYPNPRLGPNTVGEGNLMPNSVGAAALQSDAVGPSSLQTESVGGRALKGQFAVFGSGVAIAAGSSDTASVTCPAGTQIVGGGPDWVNDTNGTAVLFSAPKIGDPDHTWLVKGRIDTGGTANTLFAEANCITA